MVASAAEKFARDTRKPNSSPTKLTKFYVKEPNKRTEENPEKEAIESFESIASNYQEYLDRYVPVNVGDSAEPLLDIQAQIVGHMLYLARPLGFHRRREKELYSKFIQSVREKRGTLISQKLSASAADKIAKAEFAHIDAESKKHEAIADELHTLYQIGDSFRFAITQHIKYLTGERFMVGSDKVHP